MRPRRLFLMAQVAFGKQWGRSTGKCPSTLVGDGPPPRSAPSLKVDPARDIIEVDGQPITLEKKVYILLHKPRGYLSDTLDFRGYPSALSLIPGGERLYPEEVPKGMAWLRIVLHEGKKRHIRRMCAALGHPVQRLIRIRIGPLELGALPVGKWRRLTEREVKRLRSA
jgi:16S rRNA U516 pseudouridylate synthase RsuA-like enzyme